MSNKAVFMDRDKTLIEDPGYISDPQAVRLLPGVELAVKSLSQAGYKIIVVTNQSGVARGLLTEEALEQIHAELRRQFAERGAHIDAIYYCPFHPEGTVEKYTQDSPLRKPNPGMLLQAAGDMDIDLASSWMIGDSARDVEAGQRAGARTIRVRAPASAAHVPPAGDDTDENVQADHTARNLVDAARIILREGSGARAEKAAAPMELAPNGAPAEAMESESLEPTGDSLVRQEILRYVRQLAAERHGEEFSFTKLLAGIVQMLAVLSLLMAFWRMMQSQTPDATMWAMIAIALQVMALTFFMIQRSR